MNDTIYYCPTCHSQLVYDDGKVPDAPDPTSPLVSGTMYCPRCEMLVKPVTTPA